MEQAVTRYPETPEERATRLERALQDGPLLKLTPGQASFLRRVQVEARGESDLAEALMQAAQWKNRAQKAEAALEKANERLDTITATLKETNARISSLVSAIRRGRA